MKNLKNFAFGLLVAVLAVGFSAFTPKKVVLQHIYGLSADGQTYQKIASDGQLPSGTCVDEDYPSCYISFSDMDDPNQDVPANNVPSTAERSETDGFWDN